jgi:hypothetical protein
MLVANKVDMVEDDDRMNKYGRFKEKEPKNKKSFSDPEMEQRSYRSRSKQQEFTAKKTHGMERRDSLANGVHAFSPAQISPSR